MEDIFMNVTILDTCVGCGACAIINPEVFDIQGNKAIVNPTSIDKTEALSCPVNAIEIDEY